MNRPGQHRSLANKWECACSDSDATEAIHKLPAFIAYKLIVSKQAIKERWPPVIGPGGAIRPNKHVSCFLYSQISLVYMRCFTLVVFEITWHQTFSSQRTFQCRLEMTNIFFRNMYQTLTALQGNWVISA